MSPLLWPRSTTVRRGRKAATIGEWGVQIVRDWVMKFNALGPDGLFDRKAPGQPSRIEDEHRRELAAVIESRPIPAISGVVRWHIIDLCQWLYEKLRVTASKLTLSGELRGIGKTPRRRAHSHHSSRAVAHRSASFGTDRGRQLRP